MADGSGVLKARDFPTESPTTTRPRATSMLGRCRRHGCSSGSNGTGTACTRGAHSRAILLSNPGVVSRVEKDGGHNSLAFFAPGTAPIFDECHGKTAAKLEGRLAPHPQVSVETPAGGDKFSAVQLAAAGSIPPTLVTVTLPARSVTARNNKPAMKTGLFAGAVDGHALCRSTSPAFHFASVPTSIIPAIVSNCCAIAQSRLNTLSPS